MRRGVKKRNMKFMKFRVVPVLEGDWEGPRFRKAWLWDLKRKPNFKILGNHYFALDKNRKRILFYTVENLKKKPQVIHYCRVIFLMIQRVR